MVPLFRIFSPPALAVLLLAACSSGEGTSPAPVAPVAADAAEAELQRVKALEVGCCQSESSP